MGEFPWDGWCLYRRLEDRWLCDLLSDQTLSQMGFARECMSLLSSETIRNASAQKTKSLWCDWTK